MKHDYDISKQYQDDLIKAYNKVAPFSWTQEEAYKKAVKLPAPRYYVSAKQAAQVIAPMVRGDFERVNLMLPNRKRMYYSLYEKVMEMSEKRAFVGKSLAFIMQYAVTQPAPEFFVSHRALEQVRSFLKNGYFDNDGKAQNVPYRDRAYEKLKLRRKRIKELREKLQTQATVPQP